MSDDGVSDVHTVLFELDDDELDDPEKVFQVTVISQHLTVDDTLVDDYE